MARKTSVTKEQIGVRRKASLALRDLQMELRHEVQEAIKDSKQSVCGYAETHGISRVQLDALINEERVVCGGKSLLAITTSIKRPDLQAKIEAAGAELSDHCSGVSIGTPVIINLVWDLYEAFALSADGLNIMEFAALFAPHNDVTAGLVNFSATTVQSLNEGSEIVAEIETVLLRDDWESRLNEAKSVASARVGEKAVVVNGIIQKLRPSYKSLGEMAEALGVAYSTLKNASHGIAHEETMEKIRAGADRLHGGINASVEPGLAVNEPASDAAILLSEATPIVAPATEPDTESGNVDSVEESIVAEETGEAEGKPKLVDLLNQFGGETSPLGVPYVLTEESFCLIDGDPGDPVVALAVKYLQYARGILNILAQLKDPDIRHRIRDDKQLAREVEEMYLAVQTFSMNNPNEITRIHDATRDSWLQRERRNPARNNSAKEGKEGKR